MIDVFNFCPLAYNFSILLHIQVIHGFLSIIYFRKFFVSALPSFHFPGERSVELMPSFPPENLKIRALHLTTFARVYNRASNHFPRNGRILRAKTYSLFTMTTTTLSSVELRHFDNAASPQTHHRDRELVAGETEHHHAPPQHLPPVDGGLEAWRVLLAAFMFEAILWGFPLSFGIFQEYYSTLPQFEGNPFITYIGSIATGIAYLGAPLMAPLVKKFPMYQRHMVVVGWVICLGALVAGSFADTMGSLVATQGIMYGSEFCLIELLRETWN